MSTTQYLGLNIPSGSDLVNPLTDTFPNWDIVDNAYHNNVMRSIGRATELVSQGVHAITVLDTDCKTIKWKATANFTAGETFTVNGIQCNAYLPSGESLGTNAYVSGAQVIGSLNDDNSAITIYVPQGSVAVASDSERLGGELPGYYATKSYADGIKTTADNASELIQKKALVNTYYDSSTKKLYHVNSDGTLGGEIVMGIPTIDYSNPLHTFNNVLTYTATKECYLMGTLAIATASSGLLATDLSINNTIVFSANAVTYGSASGVSGGTVPLIKLSSGDTVTITRQSPALHVFDIA